jgi:predicted house-cleaning noncanonical NTP pyrophosphatase (MazG superfamily)
MEKKLDEEVREYQEDRNLEEIADILEVMFAICEARGYSIGDLNNKRKKKFLNVVALQTRFF